MDRNDGDAVPSGRSVEATAPAARRPASEPISLPVGRGSGVGGLPLRAISALAMLRPPSPPAPASAPAPGPAPAPAPNTFGVPAELTGPQKVIVRGSGGEIHGYAVEADGERVLVIWEVTSGRRRRRRIPVEEVFLPSVARPWSGLAISPDQLRAHSPEPD